MLQSADTTDNRSFQYCSVPQVIKYVHEERSFQYERASSFPLLMYGGVHSSCKARGSFMSAVLGLVDRDGNDCDCGVCASLVVSNREPLKHSTENITMMTREHL